MEDNNIIAIYNRDKKVALESFDAFMAKTNAFMNKLAIEEGRYKNVMNYLGGVEVSESEFQEIKDIQSNYQQSLKQVNESGKKDHLTFLDVVIIIAFCVEFCNGQF